MTAQTDPTLAAVRRQGKAVWSITSVVEGFDDPFTVVVSGQFSRHSAISVAQGHLAEVLRLKRRFIHLQEAELGE